MAILFANRAVSTLSAPINNTDTSVVLAPGTAVKFPNPTGGDYFVGTFIDAITGQLSEIVWCTAVTGDTLTIVRAQEGTSARAWNAGDTFANYWSAGQAESFLQTGTTQQQAANFAVDVGIANSMIITLDPAPASISDLIGAPVRVQVAHTNTNTSVTININTLGNKPIKTAGNTAPPIGTFNAGDIIEMFWNGTYFSYTGIIGVATTAVVQAGSDNIQPITSAALAGAMASARSGVNHTITQYFPDGTIIQAGRLFVATGNGDVIAFPDPFPNDCTVTVSVAGDGGTISLVNVKLGSGAPFTNFQVWTRVWNGTAWVVAAGTGVGWVAVGH